MSLTPLSFIPVLLIHMSLIPVSLTHTPVFLIPVIRVVDTFFVHTCVVNMYVIDTCVVNTYTCVFDTCDTCCWHLFRSYLCRWCVTYVIVAFVADTCVADTCVVDSMPAGMEDDDFDPDMASFTFTGPDYSSLLNEGITVNSIFQVLYRHDHGPRFSVANFSKFRGTISEIPRHYYSQIPYIPQPVGIIVSTEILQSIRNLL